MAKNIIVFSDGTSQEGGKKYNTNVYKLFNMVEDRTDSQVAFYDRGIGTGWRKITGNICGLGISRNILDCYKFIFENYKAGDQIYLFGFSRGAATVRSLSGFIDLFGILPKSRPELIKRAYKIYKIKSDKKREKKARELLSKNHNMWCRIQFLGVWDTVAALGLHFKIIDAIVDKFTPFTHKFHNFSLSPSVLNACQALSIDDERLVFHPILWDKTTKKDQNMKQVWFCGCHSDVGGGYKEQEVSDIPLVWMVDNAEKAGLKIYPQHNVKINEDINGTIHDSNKGFLGRLYRKKIRSCDAKAYGKPVIHKDVLNRKRDKTNKGNTGYTPWILKQKYEIES